MRKLFIFCMLLLSHGAGAQELNAVVLVVTGTASYVPPGTTTDIALRPGLELSVGTLLRTGEGSRVRLDLSDGTSLTLGSLTVLRLDYLTRPGDRLPTRFTHLLGQLRIEAAPEEGTGLEIGAGTVVAAVRGTEWFQTVTPDMTEVFTRSGKVELQSNGRPILVGAGRGVTVDPNLPRPVPKPWDVLRLLGLQVETQ